MKPVPSCPGYFASKDGHIYRNGTARKPMTNGRGYLRIKVSINNEQKDKYIHRMVCEAYHGPCPPDMECRHLDGARQNNQPNNLQWADKATNEADKVAHGTLPHGEHMSCSKLTNERVLEARRLVAQGDSVKRLARLYGVGYHTLSGAVFGRRWKHLPGALLPGSTKIRDPVSGKYSHRMEREAKRA